MTTKKATSKKVARRKPVTIDQTPVVTTPTMLLEMAVKQGADVDKLEKLMGLQERWEASEARKAYVAAMSAFRSQVPDIEKTRSAHNTKYAGLAETLKVIGPAMEANGLSHSWKTGQDGGVITVTCCVTHVMGHQECTSLPGSPDTSGSKNDIQAVGSTVSYLERYTLYAILGLASMDQDTDGGGKRRELITDEQALKIESLLSDHDLDKAAFMQWVQTKIGVEAITDIPADWFRNVIRTINTTIEAREKAE